MGGSRVVAAAELPGREGSFAERCGWARSAVIAAAARGAGLVVLPEAYLPGYVHSTGPDGTDAREFLVRVASEAGIGVAMGYLDRTACILGVATDGRLVEYRKRFLAPDEASFWEAGTEPVIAETPVGRVGLLVCADVLQLAAWEPLVGRVDVVAVAAAWPDYRGRVARTRGWRRPIVRWIAANSNPYRDRLLGRAARAVGAPVVFANACGAYQHEESFSGGSAIWDADGERVAGVSDGIAIATVAPGSPRGPLRHEASWRAFTAVYRRSAERAHARA
jgi:predicted amidohydrolase